MIAMRGTVQLIAAVVLLAATMACDNTPTGPTTEAASISGSFVDTGTASFATQSAGVKARPNFSSIVVRVRGTSISDSVDLIVGGTATYALVASIDPSSTRTLVNTATVTVPPGTADPAAGNNSDTDTDTLTPLADLQLVKSDSIDPTPPFVTYSYTLQVTNLGPSASSGVTVIDALPSEASFVSVVPGSPPTET